MAGGGGYAVSPLTWPLLLWSDEDGGEGGRVASISWGSKRIRLPAGDEVGGERTAADMTAFAGKWG